MTLSAGQHLLQGDGDAQVVQLFQHRPEVHLAAAGAVGGQQPVQRTVQRIDEVGAQVDGEGLKTGQVGAGGDLRPGDHRDAGLAGLGQAVRISPVMVCDGQAADTRRAGPAEDLLRREEAVAGSGVNVAVKVRFHHHTGPPLGCLSGCW